MKNSKEILKKHVMKSLKSEQEPGTILESKESHVGLKKKTQKYLFI